MNRALYIHIPFCRQKCPYCDFCSVSYDRETASGYVECLLRQLKDIDIRPATIYIGGGTPSVLEEGLLAKLLGGLNGYIRNASEVTIEANPESMSRDKIRLCLDMGVNRISVGVQSLRDEKLRKLGRIHSVRDSRVAIDAALEEGFENISIDLIYGIWGESVSGWTKELEEAAGLPVKHISCYTLTFEEGTPLYKKMKRGELTQLADDIVAKMYEFTISYLPERGFSHYEVSNFSKEGFPCKHNLNYWQNNQYLGLGASAVSYINGTRSKNVSIVGEYIEKVNKRLDLASSSETLTAIESARETAAVKIRTREGIGFDWFRAKTGFDLAELQGDRMGRLLTDGLIEYREKPGHPAGIRLTPKGFLFCDTVSSFMV